VQFETLRSCSAAATAFASSGVNLEWSQVPKSPVQLERLWSCSATATALASGPVKLE
jgi:hypothetical protein